MHDAHPGRAVEVLYFAGCPNHEAFVPHLRRLLSDAGVDAPVEFVEITGDGDAQQHQFLGSPTLRVGGVDVDPSAAHRDDYGMQCRLYLTEWGSQGTPPDEWILRALDAQ
ncbi:DF family (seleno)protein [Actinomycetospora sp.]|jgi:hypothetical protein|uniref:DF family (seleno)protein n=1 Tax=Actinomycetospora sp. TaxID=1872135 RepID=UPI002F3F8A13